MFKNFFSRLTAAFSGAFSNIFAVIIPIVKSNAGQLIDKALPIALGIVSDLAHSQLPSAYKRSVAYNQLQATVVSRGWVAANEVSTSVLNLIIELAVARLKAS